ncbi:MAG: hypothetical protein R3200_15075 [Xanthomonadales bacterium]|nr:hypothetical protein [Xanthomonadales bacterium]
MRWLLAVATLLLLGLAPASAEIEIHEWNVPWSDTRPRDPDVGDESAGVVWFVGQKDDYLGRLDTASGEFERIELPEGTGPHNQIVDRDGTVWIAGNQDAYIGHYDPESGELHRIDMPDGHPRDPHTLMFDGEGHIWFTAQRSNVIGRLNKSTEAIDLIEVPTERARPYGIVVDADGRPWIAMVGTYKLATVDPETLELEEILLPRTDAAPRRIAIGSDGGIWYVDYAQGYLGRLDPDTRDIREWRAPANANSRPYAMAADDAGNVWFFETGPQPNRLVGFAIDSEQFHSITEVPSGGRTVRHAVFHEPTHTIWFGADTNTIGRVDLPD